ncbi:MAG: SRPBCC family protein [Bacteroidota bacterium]
MHKISTDHTSEEAVSGVVAGLIDCDERVTWRAKHFGVRQYLTAVITEMRSPSFFADEMEKGAFKRFRHEHHFTHDNGITHMQDIFDYTSPLGLLGRFADWLFLKRYMTTLLTRRNKTIKGFAESERWKEVLFVEKKVTPSESNS